MEQFKKDKQEGIRKRIPSLDVVKDLRSQAYRNFYWKVAGIKTDKDGKTGGDLIRRILGGRDLPTVNTLVDSYNIASAESSFAIAAFDADVIDSANLMMRTANKGETFKGSGMDAPISLSGVEVVMKDSHPKRLVAVYLTTIQMKAK